MRTVSLNESHSKKEGKSDALQVVLDNAERLNESPSKKEGKCLRFGVIDPEPISSMKVYTSRYRTNGPAIIRGILICLIESPHKLLGIVFSDFGVNVSVRP